MAYEGNQITWSFVAAADLSSSQYKFVKLDSNGKIADIAAATDVPIGVLQDKPTAGQTGTVVMFGITKVQADASITAAQAIGTSADGQADVKIAGTDITEYAVGQVLLAAGAAGRIATVVIDCIAPNRAV